MGNDGKQLENLVRQVEELLLPQGFTVTPNRKVFNADGVQIAELDIEIGGRIGSTNLLWLIECRDRDDPAPAAWIEQLVGRRDRFGYNKVMAVSTSGFTPGAIEYAEKAGIELRTVAEMRDDVLPRWLDLRHLNLHVREYKLLWARLAPSPDELQSHVQALEQRLPPLTGEDKVLRPIDRDGENSLYDVFVGVVAEHPELVAELVPNGPAKAINFRARYPDDESHFVVDTDAGPVRIREILLRGEVRIVEKQIPFDALKEYRREGTSEPIAQTVTFPVEIEHSKFALELHNLADTGETHVLLRKLS